jgi:hypothetical protein
MKRILSIIALLIVGGLLARSNPDEASFREYIEERVQNQLTDGGQGRLGRILTDVGAGLAGSIAARAADRTDAVILSVYSVDLGADGRDDEKWVFLGIAGRFFEIRTPDSID